MYVMEEPGYYKSLQIRQMEFFRALITQDFSEVFSKSEFFEMWYDEETAKEYGASTAFELLCLVLPICFLAFIANVFQIVRSNSTIITNVIREFVLLVISSVLTVTILSSYGFYITIFLMVTCLLLSLMLWPEEDIEYKLSDTFDHRRHFVTNIRASVFILTGISTMASHFEIFPKKFENSNVFGYSFMDIGVGLYTFCSGLVAPEIYKNDKLSNIIMHNIPLFILGYIRYDLVIMFGYSWDEVEYGTHWNFLITIALTKTISSILLRIFKLKYSFIIGLSILFLHQYLIQNGVGDWVFYPYSSVEVLTSNREGMSSLLGYVSLYLISVTLGKLFNNINHGLELIFGLGIASLVLFYTTLIFEHIFGISACLANIGYVTWILCLGVVMGFLFLLAEFSNRKIMHRDKIVSRMCSPLIFEAANYNCLLLFLLVHLFKEFVHICLTEYGGNINTVSSLAIVVGYMGVNIGLLIVLYFEKIQVVKVSIDFCLFHLRKFKHEVYRSELKMI